MDCDDDTIRQTIRAISATIRNASINDVMRNAPYITLGQAELASRTTAETARHVERMTRDAAATAEATREGSQSARTFSRVAIGLASLSLVATALFGWFDYQSDKAWQNDQLKVLERIAEQVSSGR